MMQQNKISSRTIAEARTQARGRAAAQDVPLIVELDIEARRLGYRSWNRLINVYKEQKNDTRS